MLSKSVKAKRRRNKVYHELVRKIQVRLIQTTITGNHYLITLVSPLRKSYAHHLEASGEKQLQKKYWEMLRFVRYVQYFLETGDLFPDMKRNFVVHVQEFAIPKTGWEAMDHALGRIPKGFKPGELSVVSGFRPTERKTMFGTEKIMNISLEDPDLLRHLKGMNSRPGMLVTESDLEKFQELMDGPAPLFAKAVKALNGGPQLTPEELAEFMGSSNQPSKSTIGYRGMLKGILEASPAIKNLPDQDVVRPPGGDSRPLKLMRELLNESGLSEKSPLYYAHKDKPKPD